MTIFERILPAIPLLPLLATLALGTVAVIWDLRWRRIPNWLVGPGILLGVTYNLIVAWHHWPQPFLGIGLGFLLLLLPYLGGGIGAGDLKFLMMIGAFLGPNAVLLIFLSGAVIGGLLSVLKIIQHYGVRQGLNYCFLSLSRWFRPGFKKQLTAYQSVPDLSIPYGLAIYLGLIAVTIWQLLLGV